jgi:hypothetical protein
MIETTGARPYPNNMRSGMKVNTARHLIACTRQATPNDHVLGHLSPAEQ